MKRIEFITRLNDDGEVVLYDNRYLEGAEVLKIPEGVKHIESDFWSAKKTLKKVILPDGLKTIGSHAFSDTRITEIKLPSSLEKIGDNAFANCRYLTDISIPDGVHTIGSEAFKLCAQLKKVALPKNLKSIGMNAFSQSGIEEIVLSCSLERFAYAFSSCDSLKKVTVEKGVKEISDSAFSYCGALKEVVLPDGLEEICESAFSCCEALEKINVPFGLKSVAENAFWKCPKLPHSYGALSLSEEHVIDGNGLQNLSIETFVICKGTEVIEENAFKGCEKLKMIFIPKSVKTIGKNAFEGCKAVNIYCEGEPQEGWVDEPEKTVEEWVSVPDGWIDYQHNKMGSHYEKVKRVERNSYNPERRPVFVNVSREEFLKLLAED